MRRIMARILILYSTTDGQTLKICQRLQQIIEQDGHQVMLSAISDAIREELIAAEKIVIGASIRYGKHHARVYEFIQKHHQLLESKPNAFFTVNLVARKPEKNRPETNPYMRKFLKQIPWRPRHLAVFAGRIVYPKYNFLDRQIIRFIMWMTKGPTRPDTVIEYTNWEHVEKFAKFVGQM